MWLDNGQGNTFIGADAGRSRDWSSDNYPYRGSVNAVYNTFIGNQAGFYITNGNNNLALGFQAGYNNANGSGNVFIGNQAGYSETGSNKLYISNSSSVPPLIYGNFSTGTVAIGTTTPTTSYKLYVNGNAYATGTWSSSDIRWKMNIIPLANVLCKLLSLKGVNFEWRKTEFPEINFDSGDQIGLIAQDVEKIFPELVKTDDNGYKAVSYEKLSVILVEGMKEQQKQIDSYKSEIQSLHEEVSQIESQQKEIDELKTLVNSLVANQNGQGNK
jgi:hypothetical protein